MLDHGQCMRGLQYLSTIRQLSSGTAACAGPLADPVVAWPFRREPGNQAGDNPHQGDDDGQRKCGLFCDVTWSHDPLLKIVVPR